MPHQRAALKHRTETDSDDRTRADGLKQKATQKLFISSPGSYSETLIETQHIRKHHVDKAPGHLHITPTGGFTLISLFAAKTASTTFEMLLKNLIFCLCEFFAHSSRRVFMRSDTHIGYFLSLFQFITRFDGTEVGTAGEHTSMKAEL